MRIRCPLVAVPLFLALSSLPVAGCDDEEPCTVCNDVLDECISGEPCTCNAMGHSGFVECRAGGAVCHCDGEDASLVDTTGDGDGTTLEDTAGDGDGTTLEDTAGDGDGTTLEDTAGDGDGTTLEDTAGDGDGTTQEDTTGDGAGTTLEDCDIGSWAYGLAHNYHEDNRLRFTGRDDALRLEIARRYDGVGIGKSALFTLTGFALERDGALIACVTEAADLSYDNTHHNWLDEASAVVGTERWMLELFFLIFPDDLGDEGEVFRLYRSSAQGVLEEGPLYLNLVVP